MRCRTWPGPCRRVARAVLFGAPAPVLFTQRAGNGGADAGAAGSGAGAPVAAENGAETAVQADAQADARAGAEAAPIVGEGAEQTRPFTAPQPGQPASSSPSEQTAQTAAVREAAPLSPRAKKRLKICGIIAGALVLVLILAFAGVRIANATVYSPEHVVEEYFDAVVDGDAEAATNLIDPNVPSAQRVLLTGDVYKDAGQRISGYDVKDVEVADDGQSATATVSVTQDQRSTDTTLQLTRAGGVLGLRQWVIAPDQSGLYKTVRVSVPAGQDTLTVNGHEVSVPASSASPSPTSGYHRRSVFEEDPDALSLTVLPGEYTFAAPKGGKYLTYGDDQKVTVTADEDTSSELSGSTVEFRQRLTEQAVTDAAAKAKEKIDACVAKKEFKVAECRLNSYYEADDEHRNPSWSVEEYPTFMLTDGLNSTDSDPVDELETGSSCTCGPRRAGR
ncbi:hypothetical protein DEU33_1668 [Kocuria sp. AG109]|nr:hypothetical protein DEU33_1668 [Kocuria sp. AG109]